MPVLKTKRGNQADWNKRIMKDAQAGRFLSGETSTQLDMPAALAFHLPAEKRRESAEGVLRSALCSMSSACDLAPVASASAPSGRPTEPHSYVHIALLCIRTCATYAACFTPGSARTHIPQQEPVSVLARKAHIQNSRALHRAHPARASS